MHKPNLTREDEDIGKVVDEILEDPFFTFVSPPCKMILLLFMVEECAISMCSGVFVQIALPITFNSFRLIFLLPASLGPRQPSPLICWTIFTWMQWSVGWQQWVSSRSSIISPTMLSQRQYLWVGTAEQYTGCADSWTLELLPRAHEGVLSVVRFAGQENVWVLSWDGEGSLWGWFGFVLHSLPSTQDQPSPRLGGEHWSISVFLVVHLYSAHWPIYLYKWCVSAKGYLIVLHIAQLLIHTK